ncbi:MAG: PTS glucose transporter subunit IIA [Erysipelotrichaceae bacterium]|nr:PTS glucose transporter subunit IIA [Erysipelotrichaceae bacterium]
MGFLDKLLNLEGKAYLPPLEDVSDSDIVAIADGEMIDIKEVSDPMFAEEMMGKSLAFRYDKKTILCSPANGELTALFPTGHAYGVTTNEGVELLIHCGVDTVNAKGEGFKLFKKQGDIVKAGDPIVEVDFPRLSDKYDMSTMLILTNDNGKQIDFIDRQPVKRGQSLIK